MLLSYGLTLLSLFNVIVFVIQFCKAFCKKIRAKCVLSFIWTGTDLSVLKLVSSHFVPRSFRTQVISYHFDHFILTFIFNLVISYTVLSFRTYFHIFIYNYFDHFVPSFYNFVPKSFRTQRHFVPSLVISYPSHFVPGYEMTLVRIDLFLFKLGTKLPGYEMAFSLLYSVSF